MKKVLSIFIALGVLCISLFISIDFHAFNGNYYTSSYHKLETAESIGMSEESLNQATYVLLDYIKDKRDDLDCRQEVYGKEREVFNEREKQHMIDVKDLYINMRSVCLGMGIISMICVGLYFIFYRMKKMNVSEIFSSLKYGFHQVIVSFLIVVGFLLFYAFVDFELFWTVFHHIFFRNDLWLLDPNTSIMINMFPQEFFFGMVIRIALTFIVLFSLISGCVFYMNKRIGGKDEKYSISE